MAVAVAPLFLLVEMVQRLKGTTVEMELLVLHFLAVVAVEPALLA